jgi:hypothetical protein
LVLAAETQVEWIVAGSEVERSSGSPHPSSISPALTSG